MNIELIKQLSGKPKLYEKGSSVMWTDPHISKQLLALHINPEHDIASRKRDVIEKTVQWILAKADKTKMNILDLGCGPGLYAEYFAQSGHSVTGIDLSENSIQYAIQQAKKKRIDIEYINQNYLEIDFDNQFDLVVMIYLDFCVLLPEERDKVLQNVHKALKNGGIFICDVVNEKNIDKKIIPQSWEVQQSGFWRHSPYIALTNGYHYPEAKVLANHHIIIDEHDEVATYIFWTHYYSDEDFVSIMSSQGFTEIEFSNSVLPKTNSYWDGDNVTFCISKKNT